MGKFNILFIKTAKCATETIRVHLIEYAREVGLKINDKNYEEFFSEPLFNINTNHIWSDYRSLTHFYNSIDKKLPTIKISSVEYKFQKKDKKINKNPKSKKDYKFDSETIDLFNEYNQKDIELYNYVLNNY